MKSFYFEAPATALVRVTADTKAEALQALRSRGVLITTIDCNHLLLDLPTVDRSISISIDMELWKPVEQTEIVWSDRP